MAQYDGSVKIYVDGELGKITDQFNDLDKLIKSTVLETIKMMTKEAENIKFDQPIKYAAIWKEQIKSVKEAIKVVEGNTTDVDKLREANQRLYNTFKSIKSLDMNNVYGQATSKLLSSEQEISKLGGLTKENYEYKSSGGFISTIDSSFLNNIKGALQELENLKKEGDLSAEALQEINEAITRLESSYRTLTSTTTSAVEIENAQINASRDLTEENSIAATALDTYKEKIKQQNKEIEKLNGLTKENYEYKSAGNKVFSIDSSFLNSIQGTIQELENLRKTEGLSTEALQEINEAITRLESSYRTLTSTTTSAVEIENAQINASRDLSKEQGVVATALETYNEKNTILYRSKKLLVDATRETVNEELKHNTGIRLLVESIDAVIKKFQEEYNAKKQSAESSEEASNSSSGLSTTLTLVADALLGVVDPATIAKLATEQLAKADQVLTKKNNVLVSTLKQAIGYLKMYVSFYRIVKYIKDSAEASADLEVTQNVLNTTFKKSTEEIEEYKETVSDATDAVEKFANESINKIERFAQSAIYNFGMASSEAKEYISSFGATLKTLGIAGDLDDISIALTSVAGELAIYRNIDYSEAFTKIQYAITGQSKGLKLFGIAVTTANLQEYALENGISKTVDSMTEQEKALLRIAYIIEKTKGQIGTYSKTQDTWASKIKKLKSEWTELSEIVGDTVRILFKSTLDRIVNFVDKLTIYAKYIRAFFALIKDPTTTFDEYGNITSGKFATPTYDTEAEVEGLENITDAADDASEAIKDVLASYDDVEVLSDDSNNNDDETLLNRLKNMISLQSAYYDSMDDIELPDFDLSKVQVAVDKWNANVQPIIDYIVEHKDQIINALLSIVAAFLTFRLIQTVYTSLKGFIGLLTFILSPVGLLVTAILLLVAAFTYFYLTSENFRNKVNGPLEEAWEEIKDKLTELKDKTIETFSKISNEVYDSSSSWEDFAIILIKTAVKVVSAIIFIIGRIEDFITRLDTFKDSLSDIFDGVQMLFENGATGFIQGLGLIIVGALELVYSAVEGIVQEIDLLFGTSWDSAAKNLFNRLRNDLKTRADEKAEEWKVNQEIIYGESVSTETDNKLKKSGTKYGETYGESAASAIEDASVSSGTAYGESAAEALSSIFDSLDLNNNLDLNVSFDDTYKSILDSYNLMAENYGLDVSDITTISNNQTAKQESIADSVSQLTKSTIENSVNSSTKSMQSSIGTSSSDLLSKLETINQSIQNIYTLQSESNTLLGKIITAVNNSSNDKNISVQVGTDTIAKAAVTGINNMTRRTGNNPIIFSIPK